MEEPTCPVTPPLSTCPATPPRPVSPKSSPSHWADTVNSKTEASPSGSRPSSPENCAICLGSLTNKSFTNSCLHQFCFVCLLEWSKVKAECPLCKVVFNSIIHNVRSQDDYDQYHVKQTPRSTSIWSSLQFPRSFRYRTTVTYHEFSHWMTHPSFPRISSTVSSSLHDAIPTRHLPHRPRNPAGTSDFRRSVYRQDLWARLQPDVTGRYRECSAEFYRQNPAQLHRLIPFLNRELNVLLEDGARCAYVMERVLGLIPEYNMTSTEFRVRVSSLIGAQHAAHFCHELRAYASSPYDIMGYDRSVQYFPSAASNFVDEVNEISSPSISNNSPRDTDSDNDIQIIDPSIEPTRSPNASQVRSTSTLSQHTDESRFSPQPGPSGLSSAAHPVASGSSIVEVSSGSSSEDETDEVEIVGYVKPRHERTPEIITLSSPEHTAVDGNMARAGTPAHNPDNSTDHLSDDELICINLGSTSTVSHHLSWENQFDDISSDELLVTSDTTRNFGSTVNSFKPMRRARSTKSDSSDYYWSSSSPSRNSSGEEWSSKSKKKGSKSHFKKQKVSQPSSKSRVHRSKDSSESESEAQSPSSSPRTKKHSKLSCSKSSKSSSKSGEIDGRLKSPCGRSRKKKSESQSPVKSTKKSTNSENDTGATSRRKSKSRTDKHHHSSKYRKHSSSSNIHSHMSLPLSSAGSSSHVKSPKLRSIVMTRTTHDGRESWRVCHNESPDTSQCQRNTQRLSCMRSVVSTSSPSHLSPLSDRFTDLRQRDRHRRDSSSSSSNRRRQETKSSKSTWEYDNSRTRKRNISLSREDSCSKSSKWKQLSELDSDSD